MKAQIGILIVAVLILALFRLTRDRKLWTSKALWIPLIWLAIGASRNPAEWFHLGTPANSADRYAEGNSFDRAFLSALLLMGILILVQRQSRLQAILRRNWPLLLFFGYCAVSSMWSDYSAVSFKRWFRGIGDPVMILVVLTERERLAALKRFFPRVGFVLLPLSLLFIYYFPNWGRAYSRSGAPSWTGVTSDKNALGMICLLFGLTSTWALLHAFRAGWRGRSKGPLLAHAIAALLAVWLLVKSNSATALACWIIAGAIMTVATLSRSGRRPAVLHAMILTAVSVVISAMFFSTGSGLVQTLGRDNTFTGRTAIWGAALPLVPNPMLGAGYESFWQGARIDGVERVILQRTNEAHNGYIEIYLNLGWIGVFFLVLLVATGYQHIIAGVRSRDEASGLRLGYFLAAILYNLSEAGFKMMHPVWIAFLLATVTLPKPVSRKVRAVVNASEGTYLNTVGIENTTAARTV